MKRQLAIGLTSITLGLFFMCKGIQPAQAKCGPLDFTCKPPKPIQLGAVLNAGGFYRVFDKSEVYATFGSWNNGWKYCHVKDEAQMNRFGGFSRVVLISNMSLLKQVNEQGKKTQRIFTGYCR